MANKKPEQQKHVSPEGAVEVNEKDLDNAAGGVVGWPEADTFQKVAPAQEYKFTPPPGDQKRT